MSNVDTKHPDYIAMSEEWQINKAMASGSRQVKALRDVILPPAGQTLVSDDRYAPYIDRAIYTNFTGFTQSGLTGSAMRKPSVVEMPSELEYLVDDSNGSDLSLEQNIKSTLSSLLSSGRELLLADYPNVDGEVNTLEDQQRLNPQAYIKRYHALDLINWDLDGTDLVMAVLVESYNASDNEFEHDIQIQHRVLRLDEIGYSQQLYRELNPVSEQVYIRGADGSVFDFIPLFCIGSETNDFAVDDIPLSDIAAVNRGHYINSADYEESLHIAAQAMLAIDTGDMDHAEWKEANPQGVVVGSRAGIQTRNGSVSFLQAEERSAYNSAREEKKEEMINLGAKLIEQRGQAQTATASVIDAAGESSVLSDLVMNVEEGFRVAIGWCAKFMTASEPDFTLDMNRDFFPANVSPQLIIAGIQLSDRGVLAKEDLQDLARSAGLTKRTNEDIDESVDQDPPMVVEPSNQPASNEE